MSTASIHREHHEMIAMQGRSNRVEFRCCTGSVEPCGFSGIVEKTRSPHPSEEREF